MHASGFMDVLMGIVFVALAATLVSHPQTATVITSAGNAFSNSLKAAKG
ncbi:MAG TPA: hypothetical protein VF032_19455 [Thermoleophilaceae bacterium]